MTRQDAASKTRWDGFVPLLMAGMLLVSCALTSAQKPFWFDEILTYYFVTDPSLEHMLAAQGDLINASPPLYFLLARLWTQQFGTTELAFRLLSCAGCITGCCAIWWALRRTYGSAPAAVASLVVLMSSRQLLFNNAEARFYGVLFAELGLAVVLYARLCRQTRAGIGTLLANAAVHAALVTTHYFGLFYSGIFLVANLIFYRKNPRKLIPPAASIAFGWLFFLPCLPAFFAHRQLGDEYGWLAPPSVMDFVNVFTTNSDLLGFFALTVVGLEILRERYTGAATDGCHEPGSLPEDDGGLRALLVLALCLASLPGGIWVYSHFSTPVFLERYLWPAVVTAWCLVMSHMTWRILTGYEFSSRKAGNGRRARLMPCVPRTVFGLLCLVSLIVPLQTHLHAPAALREFLERFSAVPTALPTGLPVVFDDPLTFLECKFYHDRDNRYVVVLDSESALSPQQRRIKANLFAIASALQRQYSINALPVREFVDTHPSFAFVPTDRVLFDKWVKSRAEFAWVGRKSGRQHFYVVSRQTNAPPGADRTESLTQSGALEPPRPVFFHR